MIRAVDALQLPSAQPTKGDIDDCRDMMVKLREHITKHMTLNGPTMLAVPFRELSMSASKLLAHAMKPFGWNVNLNLFSEEPRFQGAAPIPHHWTVQLQPAPEIYDEVFAETVKTLTAGVPLDA